MHRAVRALAAVLSAAPVAVATAASPSDEDGFRFDPTAVVALGQAGEAGAGDVMPGRGAAEEPAAAETARPEPLGRPRLLDLYGTRGQTRIRLTGGYAVSVKDSSDTLFTGGVGVARFIADDLALLFELNGLWVRQTDLGDETDVAGANFNVLVQWHFLSRRDWSLFVEGGAGVLFTSDDVPGSGSSFNFTPTAGIGGTLALSRDLRLVGGLRWHHVSNANLFDDNPGRDSILGYLGVEFPF